jgi:hydrogenase maturation protease
MSRVLIVAYGNPLRSDDGAAWKAAEELSQQQLLGHVEIVMNHQLTPELALAVSSASRVVFVDAAREGVPGEIASVALKPQQGSCVFTHQFSPAAILSAARQLYGKCPDGFAVSICGECFDHGDTLSAKVTENLTYLVARIKDLVA